MSKRDDLLESVANTIADYRVGEIPKRTPKLIDRWIKQFPDDVQLPMLAELDHVLKRTYLPLQRKKIFLLELVKNKELVGEDPCVFWRSVKFLNIQGGGNSQREILSIFGTLLEKECGVNLRDCGRDPKAYVYLDDALFTGNRIKIDFDKWIQTKAPDKAKVHVILFALHRSGFYYASREIQNSARAAEKKIEISWWREIEVEDRKAYIDSSDVLRPTKLPDDKPTLDYVASLKYKPDFRKPGNLGESKFFSSEEGRHLLEQEFLKAGVRIRTMSPLLNIYQRPLGNMVLETLGFGSMLVTFRNCPNNAPLALWAGNPWYPLFPRKTN